MAGVVHGRLSLSVALEQVKRLLLLRFHHEDDAAAAAARVLPHHHEDDAAAAAARVLPHPSHSLYITSAKFCMMSGQSSSPVMHDACED
eukprot:COSAG05_NODE_1543_length_4591_cov_1.921416_5_plen_89_part_00